LEVKINKILIDHSYIIVGYGNPPYQAPYPQPPPPSSGGVYPNLPGPSQYGVSDNPFF
jgi:hypothetical protein